MRPRVGLAARRCGSTPSPSASPPQIQKVRRTGLTFAPEAGTWRMRQVINKLITEEDLYGAVDVGLLAGLAPDEALLPHRPAHRDRRGHARHRRAGPQLRRDRQAAHQAARRSRCRVGGFVPKPHTPFQWFGQNTRRGAAPQDRPAARRRRAATTACSSSGTTRRPPSPRASSAAAIAASAAVIEQVWRARRHVPGVERALRPRPLGRGHGGRGPRPRLVRPPPPHRGRGAALGPPLGRAAQGLPLAGLARRPRRASASPDCRWTPCYDCGVCTGYGIEHVVASAVPPAGRQPGHRPGPQPRRRGARRRCSPRKPAPSGSAARDEGPRVRFTQARQGPLHQPPRRRPRAGSGRCAGPSCPVAYTEGFSPRPKLQLRAGAVRPATSRWREYLDVDLDRRGADVDLAALRRAAHRRAARRASTSTAVVIDRAERTVAAGGGRRSCTWRHRAAAASAPDERWRPPSTPCSPPPSSRSTRDRKGKRGHRRPPPGILARRGRRRHRRRPAAPCSTPNWPPNPAALRPAELLAALDPARSTEGRVLRTHQWIDARRRAARAARRRARRRRAPPRQRVRHEKGTAP